MNSAVDGFLLLCLGFSSMPPPLKHTRYVGRKLNFRLCLSSQYHHLNLLDTADSVAQPIHSTIYETQIVVVAIQALRLLTGFPGWTASLQHNVEPQTVPLFTHGAELITFWVMSRPWPWPGQAGLVSPSIAELLKLQLLSCKLISCQGFSL